MLAGSKPPKSLCLHWLPWLLGRLAAWLLGRTPDGSGRNDRRRRLPWQAVEGEGVGEVGKPAVPTRVANPGSAWGTSDHG